MPWTPAQHRLFEFAAHNPEKAAAEGIKIKPGDATRMAAEGIKQPSSNPSAQTYGAALAKYKTPDGL